MSEVWRTLNHQTLASYDERGSIKNILLRVTRVTTVTGAYAVTTTTTTVRGLTYVLTTTTATTVRGIVQLFTCLFVQLLFVITIVIRRVLLSSRSWCSSHTTKSINAKQSQRATNYRVTTQSRVGVKQ